MRFFTFWTLTLLLLIVAHWWGAAWVPGLHYDEAWAAEFSRRIAFEPGFWPWKGMSPYTSPWTHYLAALAFKLFGVSLFVFRASQTFAAIIGLWLFARFLAVRVGEKAGLTFLLLASFSAALIWNHRFAIELTGWHVFCLGLVFWSFRKGLDQVQVWPLAIALVAGVTAHLLFYVVCVTLAVFWLLSEQTLPGSLRRAAYFVWLALLPFFLQIALSVPEKQKAWALFTLHIFLGLALLLQHRLPMAWLGKLWQQKWVRALLLAAACIPLVNAILFAEGTWLARIHSGLEFSPWILPAILWAVGIFWGAKRELRLFFFAAILATGILLLTPKPTPRYSEIILLVLLLLVTIGIRSLATIWRRVFILLWIGVGAAQAYFLFFQPITSGLQQDRQLRWLFFKDASSDFLAEQDLLLALGREGCGIRDITTGDGRLLETIRFLAKTPLGNFIEPGGCKKIAKAGELLRIEREGLLPTTAPKQAWVVQGYWIWSEKP